MTGRRTKPAATPVPARAPRIGSSLVVLALLGAACATAPGGEGTEPGEAERGERPRADAPAEGTPAEAAPGIGAAGQTAEAVVVHSLYRCPPDRLPALRSFYRSRVVPELRREVEEGRLADWELLAHAWGDEWNWIMSRTASSAEAFFRSQRAVVQRIGGEAMGEAHEGCTAHRDNVYYLVAGQNAVQLRLDPRDPVP